MSSRNAVAAECNADCAPCIACTTELVLATATHCDTLSATHCNTLQHTAAHCNVLQHTATHCNTLQHTATTITQCDLRRELDSLGSNGAVVRVYQQLPDSCISHNTQTNEYCHTYEWVVAHNFGGEKPFSVFTSSSPIHKWIPECITIHARMHPCHAYEWFITHKVLKANAHRVWLSWHRCLTMNEPWYTDDWVISPVWMRHGTQAGRRQNMTCDYQQPLVSRMNEIWYKDEWVMSHVWMGHVTRMNGSCHTYEWVMADRCGMAGLSLSMPWLYRSVPWLYPSMPWLSHSVPWLSRSVPWLYRSVHSIAIAVITLSLCAMTLSVLAHVRINYATHMHESCPNQRKVCECVCVCACACVCVPCGDACV